MYLKEINIENYGSIKKINYKLPFYENGNPKPLVLIGKNGSGKTLLISNIVHALIEMKRMSLSNILNILLIVVGIVLILLGIAILIRMHS